MGENGRKWGQQYRSIEGSERGRTGVEARGFVPKPGGAFGTLGY
jgi:hypothetical protein